MSQLTKSFAKYVSLCVLGMIGLSCYILADTYFISKGLGTNGLAALNLTIPAYSVINGTGMMIGMGGATKYSIFQSQKNKNADAVFTNSLCIAAFFAAGFILCGIFLSGNISMLLGGTDETFEMCRIYLQTIMIFSPAFILNNIINCFIRNDNAPRLSMAAMLTGSFANILLDYIFIFPLKMGIFGAALATCLSPLISLWVMSFFFISKRNTFGIIKEVPSARLSAAIAATGVPSLVTELSSGIVLVVFNTVILSLAGNTGVAAYGITANIFIVVVAIFNGIAQGMQPLVSTASGQRDINSLKRYLKLASATVMIFSAAIYACIFIFADPIAGIFNSEKDPVLQSTAIQGLRLYFTGCFFAGINIIKAAYFSAVGMAKPASTISVLRGFAVIIPTALAMSAFFGINGLWLSFTVSEAAVTLISLFISQDRTRKESSAHL